jgi:hypothetical protein
MKKFLYFASALCAVLLLVATTATGAPKRDYSGPACNNVTGGDGVYATDPATGDAVLTFSQTTEAPTCKQTTYSLYVLTGPGGTQLAQQSVEGGSTMACPNNAPASTSCISFSIDLGPAATAPQFICIYGTTSNGSGNNISDRAPDNDGSCITLQLDATGSGATGYN